MATYSVTINGVERECLLEQFELREAINRIATLNANFVSLDATFRPAIDDEIVITENAVRVFGGVIEAAEEAGFGGPAGDAIVTRIEAGGFAVYADRRLVKDTLPAGTLKSMLQILEPYLTPYGTTLDGAQVDGPNLASVPLMYHKLKDVLNDLSGLTTGTGVSPTEPPYFWDIDYNNVLRMYQLGDEVSPVDLIEGDAVEVGDLVVTPTRHDYANRVFLISNDTADVVMAEDTVGQGANGLYEMKFETPAYISPDLQQMAVAGLLAQFSVEQKEAKFSTVALGLHPGQTMTITSAKRNVNGSFVLTEIVTRNEPEGPGLIRDVTAVQGYRLQGSWQDVIESWTPPPGVGGGGGGFGGGSSVSCCDSIGAGVLAFSGFGDDPIKFLKPSGGIQPAPPNDPWIGTSTGSGGCGGVVTLPDGTFCITNAGYPAPNFECALALDPTLTTVKGFNTISTSSIASNYNDAFYGFDPNAGGDKIFKYDNTGTKVGEWATGTTSNVFNALGMAPDESFAYFCIRNADHVTRRDLVGASNVTFATETGYQVKDNNIVVLPNGEVLIAWDKVASGNGFIKHYDTAGAVLYTYALLGTNASPICLTPGLTPQFTVWVSYYDSNVNTFSGIHVAEIQLGGGCYMNQFAPESGSFQFDGPFCVLRGRVT